MINPINSVPLFATPTYNELIAWCENLNGGEKIAAITAAHLALNLAHRLVRDAIADDSAAIQTAWETLNGVAHDLTEGNPADAVDAVGECVRILETLGANAEQTKE